MTILLWFLFYLVSDHDQVNCQNEIDVSGYSGGSVIINCQYNLVRYANKTKRFCKMKGEECLSQADSTPGKERRFSTADDTAAGVFSVLLRNLSQRDEGEYRCEAEGGKKLTDVEIKVDEDGCNEGLISKSADPGDDVIFTCTLRCKKYTGIIYGYKVANQKIRALICTPETSTANPPEHLITTCHLTISNVTGDDKGLYLCGAEREKKKANIVAPYVMVFMEMRLQVTDADPPSVGASGSSATIITVCVVLPLLLIAGFALVVYKLRHKIAQDTTLLTSRGNNVNSDEVMTGACYEEVTNKQATPTAIYATAQKPNAPQDLYSLAQLPKAASATEEINL